MSFTYPTERTRRPSVLETIGPVLREAGLVDAETDEFTGDARAVAAALTMGLRQLQSTDPWGEPFALTIRADWRSLDGTEPGDLQMRVTPSGVQLRERTPATLACLEVDHFAQTCDDCWTVRVLNPGGQWYPVGNRIQVRIGDDDSTTECRIEIRRRTNPGEAQPEAVWSEPWQVPDYTSTELYKNHRDDRNIDTTWVDVTRDVQISTGHTFPRGVLVRRATGCQDDPWTTPTFVRETYWRWSDLISDGSMQFRCWRTGEEERGWGKYRVEVRQRVGRKPVFTAEPTWGERKSDYGRTSRTNGYTLELLRQNGYGCHRSVTGLRVMDPGGRQHDILTVDRWVWATPNLLVNASSQSSFSWRNAMSEPPAVATQWSMPEERLLRTREWTMLGETIRAKAALRGRGVRVEILQGSPVRRHWWSTPSFWAPIGTKPFGTAHDLTALRVTFRPDHVAEIQYVVPTALEQ